MIPDVINVALNEAVIWSHGKPETAMEDIGCC